MLPSPLQDGYVKNVADVVKVGDTIKVKVLSVDAAGKRLALTRKGLGIRAPAAARAAEMEGKAAGVVGGRVGGGQ